ncbi:hypothetical protein SCALM49S_03324 [Streptomyces californicus]
MTEGDHTTVNHPRGPVHSGEGQQHIYYGVGAGWTTRRSVAPLRIVVTTGCIWRTASLPLRASASRPTGWRSPDR